MAIEMKSESWIIVELIVLMFVLGILSFFFVPAYEKGAWMVMGAIWTALSTILGYKFGKNMPQQLGDPRQGQSSTAATTTTQQVETSTEVPK
jgi:hypothetical protein